MKKIALMLLLLIISINFSYSQITPGGMKYQAVARDLTGMELSNKSLAIQIVLIGDINNSDVYYSEIHEITTNKFGLFSLTIGDGKTEFGDFDTIPWSKENIWIEVNVKTDGEDYFSPLSKSLFPSNFTVISIVIDFVTPEIVILPEADTLKD